MARRPAPKTPDPVRSTLTDIMTLVGRGSAPARVQREVDAAIAAWRAEAPPDEVRDRLDALVEALTEGVQYAQEQIDSMDADEPAALRLAKGQLAAISAAREAAAGALKG